MRRAQQQTVTFAAIDSASPPARKSGLTLLASDVKISKDGAAFGSATNAPAEIGSTGRYSLVLTAAETNCSWLAVYIEKAGMQPNDDLTGALDPHPAAAVVDDVANSATTFVTDLTSAVDDFYAGAGVRFNSGALAGQVREIASYDGATKAITLELPLTAEPAAGALFELVDS